MPGARVYVYGLGRAPSTVYSRSQHRDHSTVGKIICIPLVRRASGRPWLVLARRRAATSAPEAPAEVSPHPAIFSARISPVRTVNLQFQLLSRRVRRHRIRRHGPLMW